MKLHRLSPLFPFLITESGYLHTTGMDLCMSLCRFLKVKFVSWIVPGTVIKSSTAFLLEFKKPLFSEQQGQGTAAPSHVATDKLTF